MEKIDTLVVDKTGMLTLGKPKVTDFLTAKGYDKNELLKYAASLERVSEHPLAQTLPCHDEEHQTEPFLCFCLQQCRRTYCSRCFISVFWDSSLSHHRSNSHEF